jgi:hypothetical protein
MSTCKWKKRITSKWLSEASLSEQGRKSGKRHDDAKVGERNANSGKRGTENRELRIGH